MAENYTEIRHSLLGIAESPRQPPAAVNETNPLVNKLDKLNTAVLCIIWNDILQKINIVSKALQQPGIELTAVVRLFDSLLQFLADIRHQFDDYEAKAKSLSAHLASDYAETYSRNRTRKSQPDDGPCPDVVLNARDKFRTQVFYAMLDKLAVEMTRRRAAYHELCSKFRFFTDNKLNILELRQKAQHFVECHSDDLEPAFVDEFIVFSNLCGSRNSVEEMLRFQIEKN
jgi:hypothetical protein